jgi:inner membrane protein
MASAFGHALAAATLPRVLTRRSLPTRFWVLTLVCGILPDIDVLAFRLGIPYRHPLGHRGFTHSIVFGFIWASALTLVFFRKQANKFQIFFLLLVSTLSHGVLDAMTNGGLGVGFFIPWKETRYFFPFHPIEVSPIKVERFFVQAEKILVSEAIWIGIPCFILLALSSIARISRGRVTSLSSGD